MADAAGKDQGITLKTVTGALSARLADRCGPRPEFRGLFAAAKLIERGGVKIPH